MYRGCRERICSWAREEYRHLLRDPVWGQQYPAKNAHCCCRFVSAFTFCHVYIVQLLSESVGVLEVVSLPCVLCLMKRAVCLCRVCLVSYVCRADSLCQSASVKLQRSSLNCPHTVVGTRMRKTLLSATRRRFAASLAQRRRRSSKRTGRARGRRPPHCARLRRRPP